APPPRCEIDVPEIVTMEIVGTLSTALTVIVLSCVPQAICTHGTIQSLAVNRGLAVVPASNDQSPSLEEIGTRVERIYREAKFIHIEGTSTREGHTLRYQYDSTQDSLRTISFDGNEIYGAFALHKG